jgi:hypothetical protein
MSSKVASAKSAAFLQALSAPVGGTQDEPAAEKSVTGPAALVRVSPPPSSSRKGLKHIGGYFNRADVEKFAVLRARLDLDNSQLISLAIDELFKKYEAKRAFGDT